MSLDFSSYITERTRDFTGREWVFERINTWLANPQAPRVFLLTGKPGSGKSAIAARLTQFSQGVITPNGALAPDFLSAFHFCSVRDRRWINPHVFAESLAFQLAAGYPVYARALVEKSGDRQIRLEVTQTARDVSGQMTGVVIHHLDVSGISPEDAFMRVVREPLEVLCRDTPDAQLVILVDALDEALGYTGKIDIVSLLAHTRSLQNNVRFIVTSRPDERVENQFSGADGLFLSSADFDKRNRQDLTEYINYRMFHDEVLVAKVAEFNSEEESKSIAEITTKAEGNFLYVTFLLSEIAQGLRPLTELVGLPKGLDGLYYESLDRVVKLGQKGWDKYAPLMGILSVAQASLAFSQLQVFTGLSEQILWGFLCDLEQFISETEVGETEEEYYYWLYHQSVIDFLHKRYLNRNKRGRRNRYYLPAKTWHRQILDVSRPASGKWADLPPDEPYLWRHLAAHLYAAGLREEWRQLLLSFEWLEAKLNATNINALIADYDLLVQEENEVEPLQRALRQAAHLLDEHKSQLAGELWGRLADHPSPALQRLLQQVARPPEILRLRPLTPSLQEHPALVRTLTGHTDTVYGVAVTPDGRFAISASGDKTLKVWDLANGDLVNTLTGHSDIVYGVAVSPDGQLIISASRDNTLKVWDLASGRLLNPLTGHTSSVYGVAVSPDGQLIISASYRKLKVWDLTSGRLLKTLEVEAHTDIVRDVAVSPDGRLIVSASHDRTLKVWDLSSGDLVKTLTGHEHFVTGVSVYGQQIISVSHDYTLKVWDLANGDQLQTLKGHTDIVRGVTVSPDGQRIISVSDDKTLKVWDLASDDPLNTLTGHTSSVTGVVVSPDGQRIISASDDNTLKVWDLTSDGLLNTPTGHTSSVTGVAVVGQRIISASYDGTLMVWDLASGKSLKIRTDHTDWVTGVAAIGQRIISASYDETLKVWDLASGCLLDTLTEHTDWVTGVAAIGQRIISASDDGTLKVWDLASDNLTKSVKTLTGHTDGVTGVAAIEQWIISTSRDKTLKIWDLTSGRLLNTLAGHTDGVTGVAAIEQRIVLASYDGTLKVRNLASGDEPLKTLTGHTDIVRGIAVTPNGQLVISASRDKTLRVWELATGKCRTTFHFNESLNTCAVAPDGQTVVAGGDLGRVHILRLEGG